MHMCISYFLPNVKLKYGHDFVLVGHLPKEEYAIWISD